uniref:YccV-like domain-containing protein n=1 Tax=Panagrellus redivivus TaxID=6233 RepID=A0A7E4UPL9_PANRE
MDIPAPVIFLIIFCAIPAQIYLSSKSSDMDYYSHKTRESLSKMWANFFGSPEPTTVPPVRAARPRFARDEIDELVPNEEGIVEMGYYGAGDYIRDPKPPFVKFSVGQVVEHKLHRYRGVIIGWDEKENAPEAWLRLVRGSKEERPDTQPNYAVLIDMRGRLVPEMSYVVQENLERVGGRVIHPLADRYFEKYYADGTYRPRPWLRSVYPHDD